MSSSSRPIRPEVLPSPGSACSRTGLPSSVKSSIRSVASRRKTTARCPPTMENPPIGWPARSGTSSFQLAGSGCCASATTMRPSGAPSVVLMKSFPSQSAVS